MITEDLYTQKRIAEREHVTPVCMATDLAKRLEGVRLAAEVRCGFSAQQQVEAVRIERDLQTLAYWLAVSR